MFSQVLFVLKGNFFFSSSSPLFPLPLFLYKALTTPPLSLISKYSSGQVLFVCLQFGASGNTINLHKVGKILLTCALGKKKYIKKKIILPTFIFPWESAKSKMTVTTSCLFASCLVIMKSEWCLNANGWFLFSRVELINWMCKSHNLV